MKCGGNLERRVGKKNNPFREDPELIVFLEKVSFIESRSDFNEWKDSFRQQYGSFLACQGAIAAESAYIKFCRHVHKLIKIVNKLQNFIDNGQLADDKVPSVQARLCLTELQSLCVIIDEELLALLPGNKRNDDDNSKQDYTNFHMGSVLIADEFSIYESLAFSNNFLQYISQTMLDVVDITLAEEIDNFYDRFVGFCEVMASLGLYDAMMKSWKIHQEEKKATGDDEYIIEPEVRNKRLSSRFFSASFRDTEKKKEEEKRMREEEEQKMRLEAELEIKRIEDQEENRRKKEEKAKKRLRLKQLEEKKRQIQEARKRKEEELSRRKAEKESVDKKEQRKKACAAEREAAIRLKQVALLREAKDKKRKRLAEMTQKLEARKAKLEMERMKREEAARIKLKDAKKGLLAQ